jgi:hypothetical protein
MAEVTIQSERDVRKGFDAMIRAASAFGDHEAVARLEIGQEYFSSRSFRTALESAVWEINRKRGACCGGGGCYNEANGIDCTIIT